jgi:ribosomal subunit interface protein
MQIEVHGKNLPVTEPLREYAVKKLGRLSRWLSPESTIDVELCVERNPRIADSQIAEATIRTRGETLRGRFAAGDMYAAVDGLVDRLRRQAQTYHAKHAPGRPHHAVKPSSVVAPVDADDDATERWDDGVAAEDVVTARAGRAATAD